MDKDKQYNIDYSAKEAYRDEAVVERYEEDRFSSLLGKYRYYREQKAVSALVDKLPSGISLVDCPCGNGRWWDVLAKKADHIIGLDVSPAMLDAARRKASVFEIDIDVQKGDAEALPLGDNCVDYTFCHALTKHLPIPVQWQVLEELSRISKKGIICSFGIFNHLTYECWRWRNVKESYPIWPEQLEWMATEANLEVVKMRSCTTSIGVEKSILFRVVDP